MPQYCLKTSELSNICTVMTNGPHEQKVESWRKQLLQLYIGHMFVIVV